MCALHGLYEKQLLPFLLLFFIDRIGHSGTARALAEAFPSRPLRLTAGKFAEFVPEVGPSRFGLQPRGYGRCAAPAGVTGPFSTRFTTVSGSPLWVTLA